MSKALKNSDEVNMEESKHVGRAHVTYARDGTRALPKCEDHIYDGGVKGEAIPADKALFCIRCTASSHCPPCRVTLCCINCNRHPIQEPLNLMENKSLSRCARSPSLYFGLLDLRFEVL